jgi:cyclopropane-fatty-acyl-phospholipid synthase
VNIETLLPFQLSSSGAFRATVEQYLDGTGIEIDGAQPHDLQVNDARLFHRFLRGGTLAMGEAYMDGWWDCHALDELAFRLARAGLIERHVRRDSRFYLNAALARIMPIGSATRVQRIGETHYDFPSELFEAMLDPLMVYSCAYWADATNLAEAQVAKLDLICRKLGLERGMTLLDVGCGWGGLAKYAAEHYGVRVTGITVSREQETVARQRCGDLPVEIRFQDYRAVEGQFDRVVSVGMFEHVGTSFYRTYMQAMARLLVPEGLFLLHTIGYPHSSYSNPWMTKYIFPGSFMPSVQHIAAASEGLFVVEDVHSFGPHYDRTLLAWCENFDTHWTSLSGRFDERFRRMWRYYLLTCAGSFRGRSAQLWQWVLSRGGVVDGYKSVR